MASTLSLKKLRDTSALKSEINQLQAEKEDLLKQLEREKQLVKKLQNDLLDQKKDFEHLEKQFDHFAGIEADFEALQQEVQLERLEKLLDQEKQESKTKGLIAKAREEVKELEKELKELKKLDPLRLKRQVADLKKKSSTQASENNTLNSSLLSARKELREVSTTKEKLDAELQAALAEKHHFWISEDGQWALFETGVLLKDENPETASGKRVRCLNLLDGSSVLSKELLSTGKTKDQASWHGDAEIPAEVSIEAGKRLQQLQADVEADSDTASKSKTAKKKANSKSKKTPEQADA